MTAADSPTALVYGLAVAGQATARALLRRGYTVVVADDVVTDERRHVATELGVELLDAPTAEQLREVVAACSIVSPAPGIPETHRLIEVSNELGVELVSEIELAYRWEQQREGGPRPFLAVTGTDGKTTTTLIAVGMLRAAGLSTIDAGNTDTPLVDAIDDDGFDAFVVECASFRLAWTPSFRADAAVWLNLAPDHLNWHRSMDSYRAAKFQIWANQRSDDTAIGFVSDATVIACLDGAPARHRTFGADDADYTVRDGALVGPAGPICEIATMRRSLPHDITNALAAAALVLESGLATPGDVARALETFVGPPHRLEHVGRWNGIDWFNDSKATTPHAAAVAIKAFDHIVLIAGGKDKYVDLAEMATDADRVDTVIAIGQTTDKIVDAFASVDRIERRATLTEAVELAASIATPGQTVLLSPGCASLDQYPSFEARGDEFRTLVLALHDPDAASTTATPMPTSATPTPTDSPSSPPSPSNQGRRP
ncbi:UDP-N-acetylmuramoyl-L-alanine--D-glutamate ligase [Ilumatobacter coccineus]|uniref:UDP-N-acetylmuramoylalanine--D-glutamate ligase n=1 Tax=Ilumatobacter coccineus (strain NBRC 103263 / KCTC 29153 / YM16-304) TaxID=1313172 RepID=A0A6C7EC99_ILUCY|nr:UDP-N-acetylmuramoyl-L-alanine--D-glutamate ligase [Ilumatobacter coccineus]BAN02258.1 UDP-N-acetylmuramoylalanine--D-glutamate ligase [Ilumatobacter coccineus YM16-304]